MSKTVYITVEALIKLFNEDYDMRLPKNTRFILTSESNKEKEQSYITDLQSQLSEKDKEQNQKAIEQLEKVKNKIESKVESIYKILDDLNIRIVDESTSRQLSSYEEIVKDIDNQIKELKEKDNV